MADIHHLPLVGHDLPPYRLVDEDEIRARVWLRRKVTGQPEWFFKLYGDGIAGGIVHGPYLSLVDAHDEAERVVGAYR